MNTSEKREHHRSLLITYFDTYDDKEKTTIGHLVDISYGGIMLISKQPIDTNISIPLRIDLPEEIEGKTHISIAATSVRCIKDMEFDYYNTGFAFSNISEDDKKLIDYIVALYEL